MPIPSEVYAEWEAKAERYLERQLALHNQTHVCRKSGEPLPLVDCWKCGRQRAICRSKVRFSTVEEAQEWCDDMNYPTRPRLVVPYKCYWSPGLHWHMHTARWSSDVRRARKRMSKLAMRGKYDG